MVTQPMVTQPKFGNWLSIEVLNSLENYVLITMREPWEIIDEKLGNKPLFLEFNVDMSIENLEMIFETFQMVVTKDTTIVGLGGGTSCDTAKFLAWKFKQDNCDLNLILIPSIISVDAFLCSSIAVRYDSKVTYIGESSPQSIIIDYDLIKEAPEYLNRAGVSDTISITTALGDWKLARDENNEKFDQSIFNRAKTIVENLMAAREDIKYLTENGIKVLVDGFYNEVLLCEEWGNARPEEGSEHFLAYCLESITHNHYIHGNLIGLNVLISLFLQEEYAEFSVKEVSKFFNDINIEINPLNQNISYDEIKASLKNIQEYVQKENLSYSIYNSPRISLSDEKIEEILHFLKTLQ